LILTSSKPRYVKNPVTGVYEKSPVAIAMDANGEYTNSTQISPSQKEQNHSNLTISKRTKPLSERKTSPSAQQTLPKPNSDIPFDDLLKNLDEISNSTEAPRQRRKLPPAIDFNLLTSSLDQFEKTIENSTPNSIISDKTPDLASASSRQPPKLDYSRWKPTKQKVKENSASLNSISLYSRNGDSEQSFQMDERLVEKERIENERILREKELLNAERKAADRREAEMVAKTREQRLMMDKQLSNKRILNLDIPLLSDEYQDEKILVNSYLSALMTALRNDKTKTPVPNDFLNADSYYHWQSTMKRSLQEVVIKMIKYRYVSPPNVEYTKEKVEICVTIIKASGLLSKDGKPRSPYCHIRHGDLQSKSKRNEVYSTDVVPDNNDPIWNQKLTIEVENVDHTIQIHVIDSIKEHFLGEVLLTMKDLLVKSARGKYQDWIKLQLRSGKHKDKYVGGSLLVSAILLDEKSNAPKVKTFAQIQQHINSMDIDCTALYDVLMRACVVIDLHTPEDGSQDLLSPESVCILKAFSKSWFISNAYQVISYLKILFEMYVEDIVSISELLKAFHLLYSIVKHKGGFTDIEMDYCIDLLEKMKANCSNSVLKYKELFPENQPKGALESTILVLRMIHRFPTYLSRHPELPESHRDALRTMMTESSINRFQVFKEQCCPLDDKNVQSVIDSLNYLADLVNKEIDVDVEFFRPAFAQELDIVRLTAESQLKYFVLSLEDVSDILGSDEAVKNASDHVFKLYKTIRKMGDRYSECVPGYFFVLLRLSSLSIGYIESWFAPFMYKWLKNLSIKTVEWVEQAVKEDDFKTLQSTTGEMPLHSSSITDVFTALYAKLEFITDLNWSDPVQNAQFFQAFAKVFFIFETDHEYCIRILL
jgi:hypothetical protein